MGGQDKLDGLYDIGILGNVCAHKGGGAAVLLDRRGNVRAFLFTTAGQDHFGARFGKGQRRSFADPGGPPVTRTILLVYEFCIVDKD